MIRAAKRPPHMVTLVLLTAVSTLSLTMFLPSLGAMSVEFQVDYALMNLSVAGYLAATAVLQIIVGPLSDRFGRRPVLLIGMALFAMASIGCMMAQTVQTFLVFRFLQAGVISGYALSKAVVGDTHEPQDAASRMGYISMAMAIVPILGPMAGGTLDVLFGWRANFLVFAVLGILLFALCWIDLGETNKTPSRTMGQQFRTYPELLRSRRFWGYSLCAAFSVSAFYVFLSSAPLVARTVLDVPPSKVGLYIGSITCGFLFGSFLSGRFGGRLPLTTMILIGRVAACAGLSAGLILLSLGIMHELTLFGSTIFVGIGNGLTFPSANAGTVAIRPQLAGSAAGLSGAMAVAVGSIVTWTTGYALKVGDPGMTMLVIMLVCSALGLLAGLYVRWVDAREKATPVRQ